MNEQIKQKLNDAMARYRISQNRAAKDMNYSGAALSSYRAGTYAGDVTKLEEAIVKWLARLEQAHSRKTVPVVETDDLRRIVNAISMAHAEKDIALIVADAGSGKSTAAKWYARENERSTILIEVVAGMNKKMMVQEIARRLGLDTARVQFQTLVKNTADALHDRDMVVILDEADYLRSDALEFTRRLVYDLGQSGLVLIGLPRLKNIIQNLKEDHRQLESRIGVYLPLGGLSKKDAETIMRSVWPSFDKDCFDAVYSVARTDVRQFTRIIERTQSAMLLNKLTEPDPDIIEIAASKVIRRNFR